MTSFRKSQNNFTTGVLGERAYGRTDIAQYANALRSMDGFVPLEQGGLRTMQSTVMLGSSQKYAFSFKDSYCYWEYDSTEGADVLHYADFYDTVVTLLEYDTSGRPPWEEDDVTKYNAFTSVVEVGNECHCAQVGDVMFVTFKDGQRPPHVIVHDEDAKSVYIAPWGLLADLETLVGELNIPAHYATVPYATSTTSGVTFTIIDGEDLPYSDYAYKITSSEPFFKGDNTNWLGRYIRVNLATETVIVQVREKIDDNNVYAYGFGGTPLYGITTDDIQVALFGGKIQPATVTLYEDRTIWGGQKEGSPYISGSRSNNFFFLMSKRLLQAVDEASDVDNLNFYGDPLDADPYLFKIASNEYETVETVIGYTALFVGTTKGVYQITGGDTGITPTAIQVSKISNIRSSNVQPVGLNSSVIITDTTGRVFAAKYSDTNAGYLLYDITLLYKPIANIQSMVYDYANSILYFKTSEDSYGYTPTTTLHYCAYKESAGLTAFGNTVVGGTGSNDYTSWTYGIETIFSYGDTVGFSKVSASSGSQYVETFSEKGVRLYGILEFTQFANSETVNAYRDSVLKVIKRVQVELDIDQNPVYTYTLEEDIEPVAGLIEFDSSLWDTGENQTYLVGTVSQASFTTVPPVITVDSGSGMDALTRIDRVTARVLSTQGGQIGTRENFMSDIFQVTDEQPYSGLKQMSLDCGQSLETTVTIIQDEPFPMEITSLVFRGQVFE